MHQHNRKVDILGTLKCVLYSEAFSIASSIRSVHYTEVPLYSLIIVQFLTMLLSVRRRFHFIMTTTRDWIPTIHSEERSEVIREGISLQSWHLFKDLYRKEKITAFVMTPCLELHTLLIIISAAAWKFCVARSTSTNRPLPLLPEPRAQPHPLSELKSLRSAQPGKYFI